MSGETKTLVRVFLGSPGDLDDERAAIRQAVEELNATTSYPLGYRIEVMGWEDGNAGYGRAQERINKDLETCEVFIGLMWKKWGTPTRRCRSFEQAESDDSAIAAPLIVSPATGK